MIRRISLTLLVLCFLVAISDNEAQAKSSRGKGACRGKQSQGCFQKFRRKIQQRRAVRSDYADSCSDSCEDSMGVKSTDSPEGEGYFTDVRTIEGEFRFSFDIDKKGNIVNALAIPKSEDSDNQP